MRSDSLLRHGVQFLPLAFAAALAASAPEGYAAVEYFAAGVCILLWLVSVALTSDSVYLSAFVVGMIALMFTSAVAGPLLGLVTVVCLLFLLDVAWLSKSLFGIAEQRYDPDDGRTVSRHMGLLGAQVGRSATVGVMAFALSVFVVTARVPAVTFANPVSGSGLLSLAALLLTLLAGVEWGTIRNILRQKRAGEGPA